jgi:hypothetical protein
MDIGTEKPAIQVEPVEDPFRKAEPQPAPPTPEPAEKPKDPVPA